MHWMWQPSTDFPSTASSPSLLLLPALPFPAFPFPSPFASSKAATSPLSSSRVRVTGVCGPDREWR